VAGGLLMKLFKWLKKLFRREKKSEPFPKFETVKMNVKLEPATLKVNEEEIKEVLELLPKRKPITHPARYRKFFKKKRQPTTARKLWKPNAKLEENNNGD
jgi:hypothetical protein